MSAIEGLGGALSPITIFSNTKIKNKKAKECSATKKYAKIFMHKILSSAFHQIQRKLMEVLK